MVEIKRPHKQSVVLFLFLLIEQSVGNQKNEWMSKPKKQIKIILFSKQILKLHFFIDCFCFV